MFRKTSVFAVVLFSLIGTALTHSAAPVGDTIWIYCVSTGSYVTMDPSNGNWLAAKEITSVGTNETFMVEDAGGGNILIKPVVNDNYARVDLADVKKLKANTTDSSDTLTHFVWTELGDGKIRRILRTTSVCSGVHLWEHGRQRMMSSS